MKINLNCQIKVGELQIREYGRKGRIRNELILRDLEIAGDAAGKSKASEYIAGLDLIKSIVKKGIAALKDWRPFLAEQLTADREERRERERLERIERERRDERRARKNPKGWRHVRA